MHFSLRVGFALAFVFLGASCNRPQLGGSGSAVLPGKAGTPSSATGSAVGTVGAEIAVGFSFAKPPYVFAAASADDGSGPPLGDSPGIEIELFRAALQDSGIRWKPIFWSFKRVISELASGRLDAAETSGPQQPGLSYSEPLIGCENYAITLASSGLKIDSIEDLRGLSMVAWQGASTDLGPAFTAVTRESSDYIENPDQEAQYLMFRRGRVQAVVIDKFIFRWWEHRHVSDGPPPAVVYHAIFPGVNEYRMGFKAAALRDTFNAGLRRLRADGTYDRVVRRYLGAELRDQPRP